MKTKEISKIKKKSTQKWPKVAIILLNWNGWEDTIECLESIFRNTYPNYQVIVIDNGSTDGSIKKIKAWANGKQEVLTPEPTHPLYYLSHPPIKKPISYVYYTREEAEKGGNFGLEEKVTKEWQEQIKINSKGLNPTSRYPLIFIQTGKNLGFAGGNNIGLKYILKKGNYNYVWLLNNDVVIFEDSLNQLINEFKKNITKGIVGSKIYCYSKTNRISYAGGVIYPYIGKSKHIGQGEIDAGQYNLAKKVDYITGCSMLISIKCLKEVGLLEEDYFLYFEDADFCIRADKKKFELSYVPNSKVWHKVSHSINNNSIYQSYYYARNRLIFTKKNFPLYLFFVTIATFRFSVFNYLIKRKSKHLFSGIKGILDFFKGKGGKKL